MNLENSVLSQVVAKAKQAASSRGQTHSLPPIDTKGNHATAHRPSRPSTQYPTWNSEALDVLYVKTFA